MKLLLISAGLTNTSIRGALEDLVGKSVALSTVVHIPTATYGAPGGRTYVSLPRFG